MSDDRAPLSDHERRAIRQRVKAEYHAETGFRLPEDGAEAAHVYLAEMRKMGKHRLFAYLWFAAATMPAIFGIVLLLIGITEEEWLTTAVGAALSALGLFCEVRGFQTWRRGDRWGEQLTEMNRRIERATGEEPPFFQRILRNIKRYRNADDW